MVDQLRLRPYVPVAQRWTREQMLSRLQGLKEDLDEPIDGADWPLSDAAHAIAVAIQFLEKGEADKTHDALLGAIDCLRLADHEASAEFLDQLLDHLRLL